MEPLKNPHWEAVPEGIESLLADIGPMPTLLPFYLAGGTAVALHLGHRISRDLDFFSETDSLDKPRREEIVLALCTTGRSITIQRSAFTTLVLMANEHHLSFFSYAYDLVDETNSLNGVRVAGLLDVALMKIDALADRALRRDFVDLYVIAQQKPLEMILVAGQRKYPNYRDLRMNALAAMTQFDAADEDTELALLLPIEWNEVKQFFISEAKRLGHQWFGTP
jgi:Nucleotidyl transferase AbiEii toxin, Type IV TA system